MSNPSVMSEKEPINNELNCIVNEERAIEVIQLALAEYNNPESKFFKDKNQPEESYINFLIEKDVNDKYLLNSLLLLSTTIYSTRTSVFFDRLLKNSYLFESHSWIFSPEEVLRNGEDDTLEACLEYLRPLGYQKNSLNSWYHNCSILTRNYDGDIRNFFIKHNNNAEEVWKALYVAPRAKRAQKEFHRLGPKLAALYLQWVGRYNLYDLEGLNDFGLPIDFQLSRIAIQTGIVEIGDEIHSHNLSYKILLPLFQELSREFGWNMKEISESLWLIGSQGCSKGNGEKNTNCPIESVCKGILKKPTDNKGKFYSMKRIGREFKSWKG